MEISKQPCSFPEIIKDAFFLEYAWELRIILLKGDEKRTRVQIIQENIPTHPKHTLTLTHTTLQNTTAHL